MGPLKMASGESRPQIVVLPTQSTNPQSAMNPVGDTRPQYVVIQNGTQPTMVPMDPELKKMEKARIEKLFPIPTRLYLSTLHLVLTGVAGLSQIILFFSSRGGIALTGMGIWSGLFFGIAGGVGIMTVQTPSRRTIAAFLTMNIFACIFAVALITTSWVGLEECTRQYNYSFWKTLWFSILILTGLVEGVLSVVSFAYCCRVLPCCCAKPSYETRMTSGDVAIPMTVMTAPSSNGQPNTPLSEMPPQYSNVVGASGYVNLPAPSAPMTQEKTPF